MSNVELRPVETIGHSESAANSTGRLEVLEHRLVPLGGPRALHVRRTIPQRARSLIGPWCFLDHYGSSDVSVDAPVDSDSGRAYDASGTADAPPIADAPQTAAGTEPTAAPQGVSMHVPPHPHIGLQTVSWLFSGAIEHRDSVGSVLLVEPGELNLMTAGRGISHSEVSVPSGHPHALHGIQLWTALPHSAREGAPFFEHHKNLPVLTYPGARIDVIMGGLDKVASPATVFSPLVCAQIQLEAGASLTLPIHSTFEHGILVDTGDVLVQGESVRAEDLAYIERGPQTLEIANVGDSPALLMLIGGEPFGEDIIMWWNFVARTHEEIVQARIDWQAGLTRRAQSADPDARFGRVHGYIGAPLPAPTLPDVRLRPRQQLKRKRP